MTTNALTVKALASQYVNAAAALVDELRFRYPYQHLLQAVNIGVIPRRGQLSDQIHFHFHGVGCSFQTPNLKLDLDFGSDGRSDGFDAWRLFRFAAENDLREGKPSLEEIEGGISELETAREITRPKDEPSPHLFFFLS